MIPKFTRSVRKDCIGKSRYTYILTKKIDNKFIFFLHKFGEVTIFKEFTTPLIRMDIEGKFRLNTMMHAHSFDITFKGNEKYKKEFERRLKKALE